MANASSFSSDVFGGGVSGGAANTNTDSGMNGNSLISALAGDATKVFAAYEAADVAKHTVKANPKSANTLILVVGGIAALVVVLFLIRR